MQDEPESSCSARKYGSAQEIHKDGGASKRYMNQLKKLPMANSRTIREIYVCMYIYIYIYIYIYMAALNENPKYKIYTRVSTPI